MRKYRTLSLGSIILIGLSLSIFSCIGSLIDTSGSAITRHNYIILLDLSDRIIKFPDQIKRDKRIIAGIFDLFVNKIRNDIQQTGDFGSARDAVRIKVARQESDNLNYAQLENELYVNAENTPEQEMRYFFDDSIRKQFLESVDRLYRKAHFSDSPSAYHGANIWKYFNDDLQDDVLESDPQKTDTTRNFVFVLTDGYMYTAGRQGAMDANWRPTNRNFSDQDIFLDVMLLEVSPLNNDGEFDRLQGVWKRWFQEMGIRNMDMKKRKALSQLQEDIAEFTGQPPVELTETPPVNSGPDTITDSGPDSTTPGETEPVVPPFVPDRIRSETEGAVANFYDYLETIVSEKSPERIPSLKQQAMDMFISEEVTVEISNPGRPTLKMSIGDYLERANTRYRGNYDAIAVDVNRFQFDKPFDKSQDSEFPIYKGKVSYDQAFRGYSLGRVLYADETQKGAEIIVRLEEDSVTQQLNWKVYLSHIFVIEEAELMQ